MEDGWERLTHLRQNGPSPYAFSLDHPLLKPQVA